jgi:hypothetical protein
VFEKRCWLHLYSAWQGLELGIDKSGAAFNVDFDVDVDFESDLDALV